MLPLQPDERFGSAGLWRWQQGRITPRFRAGDVVTRPNFREFGSCKQLLGNKNSNKQRHFNKRARFRAGTISVVTCAAGLLRATGHLARVDSNHRHLGAIGPGEADEQKCYAEELTHLNLRIAPPDSAVKMTSSPLASVFKLADLYHYGYGPRLRRFWKQRTAQSL